MKQNLYPRAYSKVFKGKIPLLHMENTQEQENEEVDEDMELKADLYRKYGE